MRRYAYLSYTTARILGRRVCNSLFFIGVPTGIRTPVTAVKGRALSLWSAPPSCPFPAHFRTAILLSAVFLAGCATPRHEPEREGIWIHKPRELIQCEQTPAGVVCRGRRSIPAEDVGV